MSIIDIFRHCNNLDVESIVTVYSGPYDTTCIFKGEMHSFISHYPMIAKENEVTSFFIYPDGSVKYGAEFHV